MALSEILKRMTGEELLLMTIFNNDQARAAVDLELDRRARSGARRGRKTFSAGPTPPSRTPGPRAYSAA